MNSAFEMLLGDITKVAKCDNNSRHVSRLMLHIVLTAIDAFGYCCGRILREDIYAYLLWSTQ
jgi:hypothetical protein